MHWNNLARLRDHLTRTEREGAVITRRANIAWLTGADTHVDGASPFAICRLHVTPTDCTVVTDTIEAPRLRVEELEGGDSLNYEVRDWFAPAPPVPEGWLSDENADFCQSLRASLSVPELDAVRTLGRDCADIMQQAMHDVRPGMTEHQLAARIVGDLRMHGIFTPVMLVAADQRLPAYRHPIPTYHKINRTVMAAICAQRHGLIVSITRLVHFGPLADDLKRRHIACQQVDATLHEATRPGARWCDILQRGIDTYAAHGYADEWKRHHQGGPMGYAARDFVATPTETRTVQPDQLVGWNPSVTGTKCEDTILSSGQVLTSMRDWPTTNGHADILVM